MNGRLYDPFTGRMMQADPYIQAPDHLQSFNRYSYVMNNSLNLVDPSGHSWKFWRRVFRVLVFGPAGVIYNALSPRDRAVFRQIAGIAWGIVLAPVSGGASLWGMTPLAQAAVAGFVSGSISSGSIQGGIQGAFSAGVFNHVGSALEGLRGFTEGQHLAIGAGVHAVAGCVTSVAGGSKCGPGALSAAFNKIASQWTKDLGRIQSTVISTIIGGTAAELGGGKFANGVKTAAFAHLFNELAHLTTAEQRGFGKNGDSVAAVLVAAPSEEGIYNRKVTLFNENGGVISVFSGSVDPDLVHQQNCVNGCPRIAPGEHDYVVETRGRRGDVLVLGTDGTVPTLEPNPNQKGQMFATYVYVHQGYVRGTYTEGCVAISPNDWRSFIGSFTIGDKGKLRVVN
jgi:hypothetical protein